MPYDGWRGDVRQVDVSDPVESERARRPEPVAVRVTVTLDAKVWEDVADTIGNRLDTAPPATVPGSVRGNLQRAVAAIDAACGHGEARQ